MSSPVRVGYVGGIGRSGSTLLCRVLGQVPGVVHVGEICYLWNQSVRNNRLCSCGSAFHDCPFWQKVGQQAFGGWDAVDATRIDKLRRRVERNRAVPRMVLTRAAGRYGRDLTEYAGIMARVFTAVRDVSGATVVLDNSKLPSSAYLRRRTPGLDLRVIHLVRSAQGVCYSWTKQLAREDFDGNAMRRFPPVRSAADWMLYNALFDALAMLRVPRSVVRYEDFVADPAGIARRLLDFLDVSYTDSDLDFIDDGSVTLDLDHSVWGNPSRIRTGPQQLRVDDAWRTGMRRTDRAAVTALTLPGLIRYGYLGRQGNRPTS